jgi:hypothetical protein
MSFVQKVEPYRIGRCTAQNSGGAQAKPNGTEGAGARELARLPQVANDKEVDKNDVRYGLESCWNRRVALVKSRSYVRTECIYTNLSRVVLGRYHGVLWLMTP